VRRHLLRRGRPALGQRGDRERAQRQHPRGTRHPHARGVATRTLAELEDAGFAAGQTANAPAGTTLTTPAEIWVTDENSPAAKLVRRWIGKVPIRSDVASPAKGVTIVVGESFGELREGPTSLTVTATAVVCSPPVN